MKRHLLAKGILLAGSLVYSNLGWAVGLGDSNVQSFINQPLRLEINLVDLNTSDITDLKAVITPFQDAAAADLKLEPYLIDLEIKVIDDGLLVTTQQPIVDPFINIRIQVDWSAGRLQREYMVLLDPPVFQDKDNADQSVAVATPVAAKPVSDKVVGQVLQPKVPVVTDPVTDLASRDPSASNSNAVDIYAVQKGDTLWELALLYRSSSAISVQQMMVAMLQQNPSAFAGNNINRLLAGKTLRIPTADEIQRISRAMAIAEVKRQNQWLQSDQRGAGSNTIAARQLSIEDRTDNSNNNNDVTSQNEGSDRSATTKQVSASDSEEQSNNTADNKLSDNLGSVRLITNQEATDSVSAGAGDPESKQQKITALTSELALAMEDLDRSQRENNELLNDLSLLEQQKETLQRLLELKENQLALLQNTEQIQASQREKLALDNPALANTEESNQSTGINQASAESLPDVDTVEPVSKSASDINSSSLSSAANQDSTSISAAMITLYEEFKAWFVGLGLLIILGVVIVLQRRQQANIEDTEFDDFDGDDLAFKGSNNPNDRVIVSLASQKEIDSHQWSTELSRTEAEDETSDTSDDDNSTTNLDNKLDAKLDTEDSIESDVSDSPDRFDQPSIDDSDDEAPDDMHCQDITQLGQFAADNAEAVTNEHQVSTDDTGIQLPSVEKIIDESEQLIQRGQFARAVEVLSQALEYYQQDVELTLKLMKAAVELQDIDLFNRIERSLPNELDEDTLMEIARLHELVTSFNSFDNDQKNKNIAVDFEYSEATLNAESERSINEPNLLDIELSADHYDHLVKGDKDAESSADRLDVAATADNLDSTVTPPLLDDVIPSSAADDDTKSDHGLAQTKPLVGAEGDLDPEIAAMFEGMNLDELEADEEFDFLASTDECSTKLDLARAFIDMDDHDGALNLLQEVVEEGDDEQQSIAYKLIKRISDH